MFDIIEPDLKLTFDHVNELFSFMTIGAAAGCPRRNAKELAFHHSVPQGQQLDPRARLRLENLTLLWPHELLALS
jgi:hypothetical protein